MEYQKKTLGRIKANIPLYIMTLPGIILTVLFCYLPMFGIVIAFKKINLKDGILGSPWVGFSNFDMLLQNKNAWTSIRNTVAYNVVFIGCELVFPISLPAIATIALFQTLTYWNDWYNPMLLITNPKLYNLQFLLQVMMKNIQMLTDGSMDSAVMSSLASNIPEESVRMALYVIAMGPILIVYPFFQKYFIQGLTVGAVKG